MELSVDPSKTHNQWRTQDFLKGTRFFFRICIVSSRVRNVNLTQAHYRAAGFLSPPTLENELQNKDCKELKHVI